MGSSQFSALLERGDNRGDEMLNQLRERMGILFCWRLKVKKQFGYLNKSFLDTDSYSAASSSHCIQNGFCGCYAGSQNQSQVQGLQSVLFRWVDFLEEVHFMRRPRLWFRIKSAYSEG